MKIAQGGKSFILQRSGVCLLLPISFENKIRLAWQGAKEPLSPRKNLQKVGRGGCLLPGVLDMEYKSGGDAE